MVLRGQQRHHPGSVRQRHDRHLDPAQKLLDHDRAARLAEGPLDHRRVDCGGGLREILAHDHALAGGQPVGLHDHREAEFGGLHPGARGGGIAEHLEAGRGDAVPAHERLGERLAALDDRGRAAGAEAEDPLACSQVGDARRERRLRADDDQVDPLVGGRADDAVQVTRFDIPALGGSGDAGVARRAGQAGDAGASCERPHEGVFAAAPSDDEYVHADSPEPAQSAPAGGLRSARVSTSADAESRSPVPGLTGDSARSAWAQVTATPVAADYCTILRVCSTRRGARLTCRASSGNLPAPRAHELFVCTAADLVAARLFSAGGSS